MSPKTIKESLRNLPHRKEQEDPFFPFTPIFIDSRTSFSNFAQMIDESPWRVEDGEIIGDNGPVLVEEMNHYLRKHAREKTWQSFLEKALDHWENGISPDERAIKRRSCHMENIPIERTYEEGTGTILDISVRGIGLKTSLDMPAGGWVKIRLPGKRIKEIDALPNRTINLRGLIRWSRPQNDGEAQAGIELTARLF